MGQTAKTAFLEQLVAERQQVIYGIPFKALPTEPVSLAFRLDLK